ncbi:MAG: two pore domain potassium channel family protein [Candidatus Parabeggiatoa sp. nov. 3]|jgi:voltage-gated potassium channel|nr:MAG: two pore domain potassium channel family protein [Gammaproteobacteria bacterium]RKZ57316.1 MAG: two pore domain potassium channel family protein [Gammaproteobacteria bacterium]RKZ78974.1 MAG: two pore domain potassium channel family protein [Gammaproteobacteria bacterium]
MFMFLNWLKKIRMNKSRVVKKDLKRNFINSLLYLVVIFLCHTAAMMWLQELSLGDSIWLTLTTLTTVGYGDIQIDNPFARMATISLLYFGGIFFLAKTAGDYFDYRATKRYKQFKGEWRWNMCNHIVIISEHEDKIYKQYYERLVTEFRQLKPYQEADIQILTNDFPEGLPDSLRKLGVVHYCGKGNAPKDLEAVNIHKATIIIVLAKKHHDSLSDGNTFDILYRIRDINKTALIAVECVDDVNRVRLQQAGADITIRPVRAYPEMIVSALSAPGCETVMENMFTHEGDKYRRFDVTVRSKPWATLVYNLMEADVGTAVAYISPDGEIRCNPSGKDKIEAKALIVMVREDKAISNEEVLAVL